jgi:membrane protease YdiL (CAAX protease family)
LCLFIIINKQDEVVKYSPHARAIRDVEDEELRSFFYGMSPWQFILIVTASSIGEELFYRAAVQVSASESYSLLCTRVQYGSCDLNEINKNESDG